MIIKVLYLGIPQFSFSDYSKLCRWFHATCKGWLSRNMVAGNSLPSQPISIARGCTLHLPSGQVPCQEQAKQVLNLAGESFSKAIIFHGPVVQWHPLCFHVASSVLLSTVRVTGQLGVGCWQAWIPKTAKRRGFVGSSVENRSRFVVELFGLPNAPPPPHQHCISEAHDLTATT